MYSYNPFKRKLEDVTAVDLLDLKNVSKGWYIDYKEKGINIKILQSI